MQRVSSVANVLDWNNVVNEFEIQSRYHVRFRHWSGRRGFNPMLRHTKDFRNAPWYLFA